MTFVRALETSVLVTAVVMHGLASPATADDNAWTRFRGPNGAGHADGLVAPTEWTSDDYAWQRPLPGVGHSSPVFWDGQLYLTSGEESGKRMLLCLDAATGATRWTRDVQLDASHLHKKNSYGSGSAVAGEEGVFVPFADTEQYLIVAFSHEGDELWRRSLGAFTSQHGQGCSPILYEGLVVVPNDQMGRSSLAALDATTGDVVWQAEKSEGKTAYATPSIVTVDGTDVLVTLSEAEGVAGFDPTTGEKLFASGSVPLRVVASPIVADGAVIISCGSGGRGKHMEAIDISRDGNVWRTEARWVRKKMLPYVPTPVVVDGKLYLWNDDGTAACLDPSDGSEIWKERIGGNFSGSPIVVGDRIYVISEDGKVDVINAEPTFTRHAGGAIDGLSYATPSVGYGRMYLRGFSSLACLPLRQN